MNRLCEGEPPAIACVLSNLGHGIAWIGYNKLDRFFKVI